MRTLIQLSQRYPIRCLITLSCLLQVLMLSRHQPFSIDGILYLQAAYDFIHHGLSKAMETYRWPFFSLLIAETSNLTTLTLVQAAYLLVFCFITASNILLFKLSKLFKLEPQYYWLAILLISSFPFLNKFRGNLLRGSGFYTFALLSFYYFVSFLKSPRWTTALAWNFSILLATLFRIEAGVIACLLPLSVFFSKQSWLTRYQMFVKLIGLPVVIACALGLWFWQHPGHTSGRLMELLQQILLAPHLIYQSFAAQTIKMQLSFAGTDAAGNEALYLIGGFIMIFFTKLFSTITLPYLILLLAAWHQRLFKIESSTRLALIAYLVCTALYIVGFLSQKFFLSTRYIALPALLILPLVPICLQAFHQQWLSINRKTTRHKTTAALLVLGISLITLGSLVQFGPSKAYIQSAGHWLASNIPTNANVYTNDKQLAFYASRPNLVSTTERNQFLLDKSLPLNQALKDLPCASTNVAIKFHRDRATQWLTDAYGKPNKIFKNNRGDKVLIYLAVDTGKRA